MKVDIMYEENLVLKKKIAALENKITELQMQQSCKKSNERKAGRKQYQNTVIVRYIFQMYAKGKSLQKIADKLNNEMVPTKTGNTWAKSSVRYILNNKSYVDMGVLSEKEYNFNF